MAANLFDHPYAAVIDLNNSDDEPDSDAVNNFKDSPRKVLVQENKGASLDILNAIAQNPDFSCLNSKNGLGENGFQIETNSSSCDEMETDTLDSENKKDTKVLEKNSDKIDLDQSEKTLVEEQEKVDTDNPEISDDKRLDDPDEDKGEADEDDTNTLEEKTIDEVKEGSVENAQKEGPTEAIGEQKEDTIKDVQVAHDGDKGTDEMDVSVDDGNEQGDTTDDADEVELNERIENSTDLTSEIKTGVGNGIIVSVMKKRRGRRKKRKKTLWSKPSPYKIRRVNSGSPKRISIEEPAEDKEDKSAGNDEKERDVNESSAQTEESTASKDEATQPERQDERLRRRSSSRTPAKIDYIVGDEFEKLDTPPEKGHERKKALLFHQGRKASPGQTKPLTAEESERYLQPFKQGWKRELVYRAADCATKTQADTYYFPPTKGPKLRSMVQIADWLSKNDTTLTTDNFTFMRRAIGAAMGEVVRNAASVGRGKTAMDVVRKKVKVKNVNDSHVHDDNDGQFDKPEIVIERDSDDFLAPIMSAVEKESVSFAHKTESKRARLKTTIPNLEEFKEEKVETMHPSNEEVIISPSKKKERHKATARKSTTQKSFKKSIPFTGVENLCSLKCPGMEGIPPMLHCHVCMCLFHNECVNYYDQDSDFVCLRCLQPPSAGGPPMLKVNEDSIMKVSNPALMSQLQKKPTTSLQSLMQGFPNSIQVSNSSPLSSSPGLTGKGTLHKAATPPNSMLPLYKMLPVISGGPDSVGRSTSSPFHYPVLLTKNTSAFKASSSTSSPDASPVARSMLVSSSPVISRKSPASADVATPKLQTNFAEIRPFIKQEPIDDSYQDAIKDNKSVTKKDSTTKASTEALDNLKHVLSTRLSSPQLIEKDNTAQKIKKALTKSNLLNQQSFVPGPTPVRLMNNFLNNVNANSPISISQNLNQPRMAFNLTSPPAGQFHQNQEYRIVPIGPPVPLNKLQLRMPVLQGQNFMPMPIRQPVTPPQVGPDKPVALNIVTTQDDTTAQGISGPLVVNAKSVTPMNGQLLTLPPPVVKKLTLNKPLALKINNRQITVPPSGFFPSAEGLKVFLPPNTFPTADDVVNDVTVSNEKTTEDEKASASNLEESSAVEKGSSESQSSAKADKEQKEQLNKTDEKAEAMSDVTSAKIRDIKSNKYYGKCCLIQRLYGGYDCMFHIFKHLELKDLVRLSEVCKSWRRLLLLPDLWTDVKFNDTRVSDWGKALKYVSKRDVQSISLKGLSHFEEPNRTWHQLVSSLHEQYQELSSLKKISFGLVPAAVLQSIVGRLTKLHSFIAESISDFTDDSMWTVPTKVDVGNLRCSTQLKELKLRGTGGLSLPSFSFGCGLADIGKLTTLHTLHLTSMRNLKGSDFNFISNLTNLKELALGDCENWTQETYSHLQRLTSLEKLRLESGGEIPDTGLGLALSHLSGLERLELIKYTVAYTFGNHIGGLHKLRHLCIFPVNLNFMGEVNTNVHHAVENLKNLETLEWIIPQSSTSSIILDDDNSNSSTDNSAENEQQWIPFQTALAINHSDSDKVSAVQYTSVKQLRSKLESELPNTKISVCCAKSERKLI